MKIEEQVKQILEDKLHVKIRHDGEELFDMGADGLDLIEIANELEDKFKIKIKDEEIFYAFTVRDVIRMVRHKVEVASNFQ